MGDKNVDEQFLECVETWSKEECDERLEKALDKYEDWIKNFQKEEKSIICSLLQDYNYYTRKKVYNILEELHTKIVNEYNVGNGNTIVSIIRKKNGMYGSSSEYWMQYMYASGLSRKIFYDTLNDIAETEWNNIENVVFIDDCSGTGDTITKFLDSQKKNFTNKRIIIMIIDIMEEAKINIENYASEKKINIIVVPYHVQNKAFKYIDKVIKQKFCILSQRINVLDKYILGFAQTEALMAFYNNTPNNTLGIFWYPTDGYEPIFERRFDDKPGWKGLNQPKKRRKNQQYLSKSEK